MLSQPRAQVQFLVRKGTKILPDNAAEPKKKKKKKKYRRDAYNSIIKTQAN